MQLCSVHKCQFISSVRYMVQPAEGVAVLLLEKSERAMSAFCLVKFVSDSQRSRYAAWCKHPQNVVSLTIVWAQAVFSYLGYGLTDHLFPQVSKYTVEVSKHPLISQYV